MHKTDGNIAIPILAERRAAPEHFLRLIGELRPAIHRYCAHIVGSVVDAEDVVQESLATAYDELPQLRELPALKPWLFRIAHHRAIDHLRKRNRLSEVHVDEDSEAQESGPGPDDALSRQEAVRTALSRFVALTPLQRSCVALKDVLDFSLEEIAEMLGITLGAAKAALHRGRTRLHALGQERQPHPPRPSTPAIARYADLFDARDWDGVRAMLLDDVRLELVSRETRVGIGKVGSYLARYAGSSRWRAARVWIDGREMVGVWWNGSDGGDDRGSMTIIELGVSGGHIAVIRDFGHVPYVVQDAAVEHE